MRRFVTSVANWADAWPTLPANASRDHASGNPLRFTAGATVKSDCGDEDGGPSRPVRLAGIDCRAFGRDDTRTRPIAQVEVRHSSSDVSQRPRRSASVAYRRGQLLPQ